MHAIVVVSVAFPKYVACNVARKRLTKSVISTPRNINYIAPCVEAFSLSNDPRKN